MKKNKFLTLISFILLLFSCDYYYSQSLTEGEKQYYLDSLQSSSEAARYFALEGIKKYKIIEAESLILNNIDQDELTLRIQYLDALRILEYKNTLQKTLDYLDSLEYSPTFYSPEYLLEYKVRASEILFYYNDYSRIEIIFDLLDRDKPRVNTTAFPLLKTIALEVPEYEDRAKKELLIILKNENDNIYRRRALFDLEELYGELMYSHMTDMAKNDSHPQNRIIVLEKLLSKYDRKKYNSFIRERIIDEPLPIYRNRFADLLLDEFGTIPDYNYLLWYVTVEKDRSTAKSITAELTRWFEPPKPDLSISINEMLDTLSSYNLQCNDIGWITNFNTYDTLNIKLVEIRTEIESGAISEAISQTKSLKKYLYKSYKNENLKVYALRFLFPYCGYLEERLKSLISDLPPGSTVE